MPLLGSFWNPLLSLSPLLHMLYVTYDHLWRSGIQLQNKGPKTGIHMEGKYTFIIWLFRNTWTRISYHFSARFLWRSIGGWWTVISTPSICGRAVNLTWETLLSSSPSCSLLALPNASLSHRQRSLGIWKEGNHRTPNRNERMGTHSHMTKQIGKDRECATGKNRQTLALLEASVLCVTAHYALLAVGVKDFMSTSYSGRAQATFVHHKVKLPVFSTLS